jgi:hypothetical protein
VRSAYGLDHDVCLDRRRYPAKITGLLGVMAADGNSISDIALLPSATSAGSTRSPPRLADLLSRHSEGQPRCPWPIPRRPRSFWRPRVDGLSSAELRLLHDMARVTSMTASMMGLF